MQAYHLLHNAVLVFKNGRVLYSLPSGVSEKKTPCNTDFFQASAIIVFCIVSTMICSAHISASKERTCSLSSQWWPVLQQHHRVACAGPKPHCCAQRWRGSSLPTKRHGAKPVFLKEGEGWSTGPSCCIVLSSSGVAKPRLAVNLSVCLHCISQGLHSLLLNFNQTHCVLSHFDEFFVCEDGCEGPAWAHPSRRVCTLLLQNLMAQCETEESFHILNPNSSILLWLSTCRQQLREDSVVPHLRVPPTFLRNTMLRQVVLNCWAVWRHHLIPACTVLAIRVYLKTKCKIPRRT